MKTRKVILKVFLLVLGLSFLSVTSYAAVLLSLFAGEKFYAVFAPAAALILVVLYIMFLFWSSKRRVIVIIGVAFVLLAAASIAVRNGYQAYQDTVPTVSIQDVDLSDYAPFHGEKRTLLDKSASIVIKNDFPVLDGSSALYPVYGAFAEALNPDLKQYIFINGEKYYNKYIQCNNTANAYENLIKGKADIIFVSPPSQKQLDDAKKAGVTLNMTPIGKEAFVFFVNRKNPVSSLTLLQIKDIYADRIKNWKEVGGRYRKIRAFQRPEGSGSQTALQKLMYGDTIMKAPHRDVPAGMGGIVRRVADYQNYGGAIGFSFRFFLLGMMHEENIKILEIGGIYPSEANIADNKYPLTAEFYAVTAGSKNQNVKKMIKWILSAEGQEIIRKTGYFPVNEI